jgi:hypothetical protein
MATGKNFYSKTNIKDFYLDLANLPTARKLAEGQRLEQHIVTARQQYRPDLLSYDLYGNSNYWWTIVLLNRDTLKDPIRDLKTGTVLRIIPSASIAGVV